MNGFLHKLACTAARAHVRFAELVPAVPSWGGGWIETRLLRKVASSFNPHMADETFCNVLAFQAERYCNPAAGLAAATVLFDQSLLGFRRPVFVSDFRSQGCFLMSQALLSLANQDLNELQRHLAEARADQRAGSRDLQRIDEQIVEKTQELGEIKDKNSAAAKQLQKDLDDLKKPAAAAVSTGAPGLIDTIRDLERKIGDKEAEIEKCQQEWDNYKARQHP